jgi:predicted TIM-barrel fold metal-dependent hydrolase
MENIMNTDARPFDADNHYYEALDAFTRHLDPAWRARAVDVAEVRGRVRHVVGGRVSHAVTNPTFNPIVKPGCLYGYFRSNPDGRPREDYMRESEPIPAHYRNRDARISVMDEQGLSAVWMFPTLGVLYEHELRHDPQAVAVTFRAFNRWLDEDWGLHYQDRIFGVPYIPLVDVDFAVSELEWAIDGGARLVCMRPAAPNTAVGPRSPADPMFDPFWARVNEAGITVAIHSGESGYGFNGYAEDGPAQALGLVSPLKSVMHGDRPIMDFLSALICDKLFERFPNVRVATIENGAAYVDSLLSRLHKVHMQHIGYFGEDPADTFRRHIWINPFWEDDLDKIVEQVGADHVLFGSDWPHAEGLAQPLDYFADVAHLDTGSRNLVMRDNAVSLTQLQPV